jgi:hypothetical protein
METDVQYPLYGSCNCGFITYQVTEPFEFQVACHCTQCQKHSQSAFSLTALIAANAFRVTAGTPRQWTKIGDSGTRYVCYFCPQCGNRIYHQNPERPEKVRVKLGTLEDTVHIRPDVHIWTQYKQRWFSLPEGVASFPGQPDLEKLAARQLEQR